MPITITIEGQNADEVRQLVQDLAGTITNIKSEDIVDTKVSTIEQSNQTPAVPPVEVTAATTPTAPQQVQIPVAPVAPATPAAAPTATPTTVPTSAPTYDFNQLATATMQLQRAGQNIFEIFGQFGIQALNQLPKERYGEYAAVLRQRGAKI